MNVSIVTLFPDLYKSFLQTSLLRQAQEKNLVSFSAYSLFNYVEPKERIDAPTFGHSSGMLIRPDVIQKAFNDLDEKHSKSFKIMLSPQGKKLNQRYAKELWEKIESHKHVLFFASRYEGIDDRVQDYYADEIVSVGDFVAMGGDIPAMLLIECLFRFMPGVVGKQESVEKDSFSGAFLDHPEYTKPVEWNGLVVPEILRSGNHAAIDAWRKEQAVALTVQKHFNWLQANQLEKKEIDLVKECIPPHYVVLLHTDVLLKEGQVGTSSVTTLDIHDIARSSATYGLKNFFVVTSLKDQQKLVSTVIDFWQEKEIGGEYNKHRHQAVNLVMLKESLDEALKTIEEQEGQKPIIIGTSAKAFGASKPVTYFDQNTVWQGKRPVLFLLGTAHGIAHHILEKCDYMLPPLQGFSHFNHLSVRSAAAIIFDKWLGVSRRV